MTHSTPDLDHYVYQAVAEDGTILYVGVTGNLKQRITYHRYHAQWAHQAVRFDTTGPLDRETAYALEREEIRRLNPKHNRQVYGTLGLTAREPVQAPLAADSPTTKQVSEELGVSVRTVGRMIRDGIIHPAYKAPGLSGPYLFTRAEVDRVKALRGVAA